mmetsp:Transcript_41531/g.102930  ORF Transcript_41531/g.102930 Transcript_41531/m.102930 type:complete len:260 (-) Transcript_41531:50-829(-)
MRKARTIRRAVSKALDELSLKSHLNTTHTETARTRQAYANLDALIRSKAEIYKRSTFCVIPPGDSAITTRIFSAVASVCIPVFLVPTRFMPFPLSVDWAAISIYIDPLKLLKFEMAPDAKKASLNMRNPLAIMQQLMEKEPARVRAMQAKLSEARWHLLYHDGNASAHYTGPARTVPSAGAALARELVAAAATRQAQIDAALPGASAQPPVLGCMAKVAARLRPETQVAKQAASGGEAGSKAGTGGKAGVTRRRRRLGP